MADLIYIHALLWIVGGHKLFEIFFGLEKGV